MLKRLKPLLLTCLLLPALVFARSAPLVEPAPITVPAGLQTAAVEKAIRTGLLRREWTAQPISEGHMQATLVVRNKHTVKVDVAYDAQSIRFKYLSSANMNYELEDGVAEIHPNYMKWMDNVRRDIEISLLSAP